MSVTSLPFFCFFALSLAVYYIVPQKFQWFVLLVFSMFFFLNACRPYTIIYLLCAVVITTFSARGIANALDSGKKDNALRWLVIGITTDVGILAVLKYSNFFISNIISVSMGRLHIDLLQLAAPVGISFYTLQLAGYLLDVYWGITEYQPSFLKTMLFAGYFPQMTSGPISRYAMLKDTLYSGHKASWQNITFGLERMLWGVFKKLVISERAGIIVDTIYGNPDKYDGFYIIVASALFMMQLYTDFSGCMDIVIGASECYGIELPENFRTPFFSRTVQEYWQRWHITLGEWLKDYILFTILRSEGWRRLTKSIKNRFGKKAAKQIPAYLGMLCVWLLIGLWHGGAWKYILGMGLWFWVIIVLEQVLAPHSKKLTASLGIDTDAFGWHFFQSLRVFVCVCIGNMFFRLSSIPETFYMLKQAAASWNPEIFFDGSLYKLGLEEKDCRLLLASLFILLIVSALQEKESVRILLAKQILPFRWIVLFGLLFLTLIVGIWGPGYDTQTFIYEAF